MSENAGKTLIAGVVAFAISWFLVWLIASYNAALLVDPILTTYYGISELGWIGIIALIALVIAGIAAFKIKPKKSKKGGSGILIVVVVAICLGAFFSWLVASYVPELLYAV